MNREQYLLTKLAEECNEVAQMALKTQQFGMEEKHPDLTLNNKERLHEELNDLNGIVKMLNDEFGFNYSPSNKQMIYKSRKVDKFYHYSVNLGLVDEG